MKPTKDELSKMIGFEISPQLRKVILAQVRETGKDIREVASQWVMAPLISLEDDGTFTDNGKHYKTSKEWEKDSPLGPFSKLILVGTDAEIKNHRELESNELNNK